MTIWVFGEGSTENDVCKGIANLIGVELKYISATGNTRQVNKKVVESIRPLIEEGEPVSCAILYDLDSHENKTEVSILQSISGEGGLKKIDALRAFDLRSAITQNSIHTNLYTLSMPELKFNLAIHITTKKWKKNFIKSAIDDYVLELALLPKTVNNLLADINKTTQRINIPSSKISDKVTKEIPELLKSNANGIDDLIEAKDYVRLYAVVLKLHTSPAVFAQKVMANADDRDIREVFGALIAAFEFVGGA